MIYFAYKVTKNLISAYSVAFAPQGSTVLPKSVDARQVAGMFIDVKTITDDELLGYLTADIIYRFGG